MESRGSTGGECRRGYLIYRGPRRTCPLGYGEPGLDRRRVPPRLFNLPGSPADLSVGVKMESRGSTGDECRRAYLISRGPRRTCPLG